MHTTDIDRQRVVSLTIPADAKWLGLCRLVLTGLCQLGPVDEQTLADLKLAVTEACSNSIRHAYGDGGGMVGVRYELGAGSLAVEVTDSGRGFQLDRPVPELAIVPAEDLREDEMGLAIIHALTDQTAISTGPGDRGTRISFVKHLPGGPHGPA
jgi:serine/threonine-protein kinase RsbW